MSGRPPKSPTRAQRDQVQQLKADGWSNDRIARLLDVARNTLEKWFGEELEFGADVELSERLKWARKAAKKGNMTAIKWLDDRQAMARAAEQIEGRANSPRAEEPARRAPAKGKKEIQQDEAEAVSGKFAPPPAPPKLH